MGVCQLWFPIMICEAGNYYVLSDLLKITASGYSFGSFKRFYWYLYSNGLLVRFQINVAM